MLGALTGVLFLFAVPARAQSANGRIDGQIMNGTKDAKPASVQNLNVRLFGMNSSATQPFSSTVQTDAQGRFSFPNLANDSTTKYLLTAQYSGVDYFSDPVAFDGIKTTVPTSITIYETTTDQSVVKVNQTHLIFDIQKGTFTVLQIVAAENTGDRTLVHGSSAGTLILPILSGAQNLQFDQQDIAQSTLRGDGVMTYTLPFPPGSDQIVYNYTLPFTPPNFQFKLTIPYDSAVVRLLVSDVGESIQSAQFASQSPFQAQNGQKFLLNVAPNVKAGTVLYASFSNLSATASSTALSSSSNRASNQNEPVIATIIVSIAAALSVALLAYPIVRRRVSSPRQ